MLYPVYVHVGNEREAHGVTFPDFPGCFSAADEAHFHGEPEAVPPPTPLDRLVKDPEYQGGVWLLADIDLSRIETKPMRLNISLPSNLVQQIDA